MYTWGLCQFFNIYFFLYSFAELGALLLSQPHTQTHITCMLLGWKYKTEIVCQFNTTAWTNIFVRFFRLADWKWISFIFHTFVSAIGRIDRLEFLRFCVFFFIYFCFGVFMWNNNGENIMVNGKSWTNASWHKSVKFTMCKLLIELKVQEKKEHNKNKPSHAQCHSMNADHHFIWITQYLASFRFFSPFFLRFFCSVPLHYLVVHDFLLLCDTVKVLLWFDTTNSQQNFHSSTSHFAFAYNNNACHTPSEYLPHHFLFILLALCLFWFLLHF